MALFVTGNEIESAFRNIALGEDLRCAVSFWDHAGVVRLRKGGAELQRVRIICNLSAGDCTPEALRELGAPENVNLRYLTGLNANVWISSNGALIGSAPSRDGITNVGRKRFEFLDAATYYEAGSSAWQAASNWYALTFERARPLESNALELARFKFNLHFRMAERRPLQSVSLLDFILENPEKFEDVGFAITSAKATEKERSKARQGATAATIAPEDVIESLPSEGIIIGMAKYDVLHWPTYLIEFYCPKNVLKIALRSICVVDFINCVLFTKRDPKRFACLLPEAFLNLHGAERTDVDRIRMLRDAGAGLFPTAAHLAQAIGKL